MLLTQFFGFRAGNVCVLSGDPKHLTETPWGSPHSGDGLKSICDVVTLIWTHEKRTNICQRTFVLTQLEWSCRGGSVREGAGAEGSPPLSEGHLAPAQAMDVELSGSQAGPGSVVRGPAELRLSSCCIRHSRNGPRPTALHY